MESLLNQVYQLEKELIENKNKFESYGNREIQCIQNIKIFETSIKELEVDDPSVKVYQPLGKAFLMRPRTAIKADLEFLLQANQKGFEEDKQMKVHFEGKKIELERQLIELTKTLKLN